MTVSDRSRARRNPERFARIHRSEIVAIHAVREVQPHFHGDGQALAMTRLQFPPA